jgi:hypothetical protein
MRTAKFPQWLTLSGVRPSALEVAEVRVQAEEPLRAVAPAVVARRDEVAAVAEEETPWGRRGLQKWIGEGLTFRC